MIFSFSSEQKVKVAICSLEAFVTAPNILLEKDDFRKKNWKRNFLVLAFYRSELIIHKEKVTKKHDIII